jgi:hypothetical protein
MLRISQKQNETLQAYGIELWYHRLMAWLRHHAEPALAMDDPTLLALIKRQANRAAEFGIESERGLAKWCYLAVVKGEGFENDSDVADVLNDPAYISADERIDTVLRFSED